MTQFGSDVTDQPVLTSAVTPKQGVSSPSILGAVAEVFGAGADLYMKDREAKAEQANQGILNDFFNTQMAVVNAVDQGKYKHAFARSLLRKNFQQFFNDNPGLQEELMKSHKDIVGTAGLGKFVFDDSEEEERINRQNQNAVDAGLVSADGTEEEFAEARAAIDQLNAAKTKYEAEKRDIALQRDRFALETDKLDMLDRRQAKASYDFLVNISPSVYIGFKTQVEQILASDMDPAAKQREIEGLYNSRSAEFSADFVNLDSTQAGAIMKPFDLFKDTAIAIASGKMELESLETQNKTVVAMQESLLLGNEKVARVVASSNLLGENFSIISASRVGLSPELTDFLLGNSSPPEEGGGGDVNPFVTETENVTAVQDYTKILKSGITNYDTMSAPAQSELKNNLTNIMQSIEDYEGFLKKNPKGAIEMYNFFSSEEFIKARQKFPEVFSNMDSARQVLVQHYDQEVYNLIQEEFRNSDFDVVAAGANPSGTGNYDPAVVNIQAQDAINYDVGEDGSVRFYSLVQGADITREVARLNKELAPILNKSVKAWAHLDGNQNYKSVAEQAMSVVLGEDAVGRGAGEGEDTLEVGDFRIMPTMKGESEQLSFLMDRKEGGGEYDTLFGFSNRSGRQFSDVDVTQMTLEEVIEFSSVDGEYGKWVKDRLGASGQEARIATPMGRYQIVGTTLRGLVEELDLPLDTKFNAEVQDLMFQTLMARRLSGKTSMRAKMSALRQEWEGFKYVSDRELASAIQEYEASLQ